MGGLRWLWWRVWGSDWRVVGGGLIGGYGGVVWLTVGGRGWGVGYRTGGGGSPHRQCTEGLVCYSEGGVPLYAEAGIPDCTTVYGCPGVESV